MENSGQAQAGGSRVYEPPPAAEETAGLSYEEAKAAADRMGDEMMADPRHPIMDRKHRLRDDYMAHRARLFEVIAAGETQQQAAEETQQAADVETGNTPAQRAVYDEAQRELGLLKGLGFEPIDIPSTIEPHVVATMKMQRLNAQGDTAKLIPLITRQLQELRALREVEQQFTSFAYMDGMDQQFKAEIMEKVIGWIHQANVKRFAEQQAALNNR